MKVTTTLDSDLGLRKAAHEALREGWDFWELPLVLYGLRRELGVSRAELDEVLRGMHDER